MKTLVAGGESTLVGWRRTLLLIVLGYEGLGAIVGGILLIIAPSGRLMEMPVGIMHGAFADFLIPGIILLALGLLVLTSFFIVLRRIHVDWVMAYLSLCGLLIWFIVEIIIIQEVVWLHAMWGLPVVLGCIVATPMLTAPKQSISPQ